MNIELRLCDRTGKPGALPFRYWSGRQNDGAGKTEDCFTTVDLSHEAAIDLLAKLHEYLIKNYYRGESFDLSAYLVAIERFVSPQEYSQVQIQELLQKIGRPQRKSTA